MSNEKYRYFNNDKTITKGDEEVMPQQEQDANYKIVSVGFRFDEVTQQHIPSLEIEFDPIPFNAGNDAKGWKDRDNFVKYLAATPPLQQKPLTKPRLIGWRTSDYLMETSDIDKAKNWENYHEVMPIFEGDVNTQLMTPKKVQQDEPVEVDADLHVIKANPRWFTVTADMQGELREVVGKDEPVEVDAYLHACSEMEYWQAKRAKAGKEIGTEGSLCDGIAWLFDRIEKLESKFVLNVNDILVETCDTPKVGGFALGTSKGVRLTHRPTGTVVQCDSERSQHGNRAKAWLELEILLSTKPDSQRQWVGLTDDEIEQCYTEQKKSVVKHKNSIRGQTLSNWDSLDYHLIMAVEAKLKEKNT